MNTVFKKALTLLLAIAMVAPLALAPVSASAASIKVLRPEEGEYMILSATNPRFVIDVTGASTDAGTVAQIFANNGGLNQRYRLERVTGDWYRIVCVQTGLCLNLCGGVSGNGVSVILWPYDGNGCLFRFLDGGDGTVQIQNRLGSQRIFDISNNNVYSGAKLQFWDLHNGSAGKFRLIRTDSGVLTDGAQYSFRPYADSNMCINVLNRPSSGSAKLGIYRWTEEDNTIFTAHRSSLGGWYFTPQYRPDLSINCLYGCDAPNGSQAVAYPSSNTAYDLASLWLPEVLSNGYVRFINMASGLILDNAYGKTDSCNRINVYTSSYGSSNSWWKVVRYEGNSTLQGVVTTSSSNLLLRSSAPSGSTLARMPKGSVVAILDNGAKTSGYYHVQYGGYTGYASAQYITISGSVTPAPAPAVSGKTMNEVLYGCSGGRMTCGFHGYTSDKLKKYYHEGYDFVRKEGASVYSLIEGTITNVSMGTAKKPLTTVAIYDKAADKTVVYLHLAPSPDLAVGAKVYVGTLLGTESSKGADAAHTHVEVRNGYQTKAAVSMDTIPDNDDPASYWTSKGYTIK